MGWSGSVWDRVESCRVERHCVAWNGVALCGMKWSGVALYGVEWHCVLYSGV